MAAGYLPRTKIFHEVGKGTVMAGTRRVIDRAQVGERGRTARRIEGDAGGEKGNFIVFEETLSKRSYAAPLVSRVARLASLSPRRCFHAREALSFFLSSARHFSLSFFLLLRPFTTNSLIFSSDFVYLSLSVSFANALSRKIESPFSQGSRGIAWEAGGRRLEPRKPHDSCNVRSRQRAWKRSNRARDRCVTREEVPFSPSIRTVHVKIAGQN